MTKQEKTNKDEQKKYIPQYNVWLAGSGTPVITISDVYKALKLKPGDKIEIENIRKVEEPTKEKEPKDIKTERKKTIFK